MYKSMVWISTYNWSARRGSEYLDEFKKYESIDSEISITARNVLKHHLWYLTDEFVGFALIFNKVTNSEKLISVTGMLIDPRKWKLRRNSAILGNDVSLEDLVTNKT